MKLFFIRRNSVQRYFIAHHYLDIPVGGYLLRIWLGQTTNSRQLPISYLNTQIVTNTISAQARQVGKQLIIA